MVFTLKLVRGRLRLEFLTLVLMILSTTIGIISLFFIILPSLVYRWFVVALAKCLRPDLTHVLNRGNQMFALENVTERAKSNIVVPFVLDGQISEKLEQLRYCFTARVLDKSKSNVKNGEKTGTGKLIYPELRQFWTSFMGYFFWKNEPNFDIKAHIRIFDYEWTTNDNDRVKIPEGENYTEKDVQHVATRLLSEPWKKDFSLWELLVIPNYHDNNRYNDKYNYNHSQSENEREKSVVILRFHHSMGDGIGWLKIFLYDLFQCKDAELPQMTGRKKSAWWKNLVFPLKFQYDLAKNTVESFDTTNPSRNPWHTPEKRSKKYYTSISPPISVQRIKDLKNKFGVSYAAILITAISGGIRRVMKEAGQNVPKKIKTAMILPLPNHPGNICIHATGINLRWPIGTEDPILRLEEVWREMRSKKSSLFPLAAYFNIILGRVLPNFIVRMLHNKVTTTMGASLFPGPEISPIFEGHAVLDSFFFLGHLPGQLGAGVTSMAMNGNQRIAVTVDQNLFPSQEQFEPLGGFIEQEILALDYISAKSFRDRNLTEHEQNIEIDIV